MNIQQIYYILAVAEYKHFEMAADKCFITQSTLSTMISKYEDEIGIKIFDRKKKPVQVTVEGIQVIQQLKIIRNQLHQLDELVKEIKGEIKGELSLAVIPTIAPYLLPLFLKGFALEFPALQIQVKEQTTQEIVKLIKSRELDIGIVSIPISDKDINEIKLYDEPFVYFDAGQFNETSVDPANLDISNLCLLEEGHCLRTQVIRLCELHKNYIDASLNFDYRAGSIDSLIRFAKANRAATLIPWLATLDMSPADAKMVIPFKSPKPRRTVGIIYHRHFVKQKVLQLLKDKILGKIIPLLPEKCDEGPTLNPF